MLLALAPLAAGAATLYVDDGGGDCAFTATHDDIQEAVDAAAAGGARKIHVCPGDYPELVTITGFRRLVLEADPGVTVRPPAPLASGEIFRVLDSRWVEIRGFTLDGDGQFSGAGIYARGISYLDSSGEIEDNSILGIAPSPLVMSFSHAIDVADSDPADAVRVKVRIRRNTLGGYGQLGMDVSATSVRIEDNVLIGMGPTDVALQGGMILREVRKGRVRRNSVSAHWFTPFRASAGIYLAESTRVRVEANDVIDCHDGIAVVSGTTAASRNRISDNDVAGAAFGITVAGTAGAPAEGNRLVGNRIDGSLSGLTGIEIRSDSAGTRVLRNEVGSFVTPLEDGGTDTRFGGNLCGGAACP